MHMWSTYHRQRGASTFATIGAFIGLGVVFLGLFFLTTSGNTKAPGASTGDTTGTTTDTTSTSSEPPYIRLPENSKIYKNTNYKFLFAYPDSFGDLTIQAGSTDSTSIGGLFQAQSALAAQKPIGDGTAFMNGRMAVYVFSKDNFKVVVNSNDVSVAPTTTGSDTTWKVVSRGNTTQDLSIGDAYTVKSVKSQTGIQVFDFTYRPSSGLALGRWVFATGDNFVMVALPSVSRPSGDNLSDGNFAAYDIIGNNIAKTVRVPDSAATSTDTNDDSTDSTSN